MAKKAREAQEAHPPTELLHGTILSRVGVTWYTFKQKAPKFRVDWYKGAHFCKIVKFFDHYNRLKRQTLNGRLPPEDSSVFDDSVCVLIVMT